ALATRFQAEVPGRACVEDLLDHFAHLVHLGRVDAEILPFVPVLRDRAAEHVVELLHPAAQQVLEAHHAGKAQLALADVVDHVHQVDHRAGLTERVDYQVALGVDAEVTRPPTRNVVQLQGSLDGPIGIRHWFGGSATARQPITSADARDRSRASPAARPTRPQSHRPDRQRAPAAELLHDFLARTRYAAGTCGGGGGARALAARRCAA